MPAPDPSRVIDTLCAYWETATLGAAIDLGVFTALGRRARTGGAIAAACGANASAVCALCDSLVSMRFLRVRSGRYRAAPDAARFLDARSPEWIGGMRGFFNAPPVMTAFQQLATTIRRGTSGTPVAARSALWTTFASSTLPLRRRWAADVARELHRQRLDRGRILDVGAGASPLGIEILRRSRSASLVVQDRASVVKVALQHAVSVGVGNRVTALRGDATTRPWGGPFELVLMVNLLDYFDLPTRRRLLRKARAALAPGGVLVVCAPLLDDGRRSPPEAVAYNLMLLALGARGQASTFRESSRLLRGAGFTTVTRCVDLPAVLATRRRGDTSLA
jgi:SAM-dependent methyltransferase